MRVFNRVILCEAGAQRVCEIGGRAQDDRVGLLHLGSDRQLDCRPLRCAAKGWNEKSRSASAAPSCYLPRLPIYPDSLTEIVYQPYPVTEAYDARL